MDRKKKLIAALVAVIVIAAALVAVVVGRNQSDSQMPGETVTQEPAATEETAATEEPVATEEPAETEEPTAEPTEEPVAAEEPTTEVGGADEPETVAVSAQTNPGDVMVLVNGEAITRETFESYRSSLVNYFSQYGYDMTNEDNMAFAGAMAMSTVVEDTLLFQKAADLGLDPSEEELAQAEADNAEEWASAVDMYMTYYFGVTEESTDEEKADARLNALALLESMGYTESSLLKSAVDNLKYEKVYAYMVEGAQVTDEDVQAAYEAHVAEDQAEFENDVAYYEWQQAYGYSSYYMPAGYRGVKHILLEVDQALLDEWQSLSARLEEQQDEVEYADEEAESEDADGEQEEKPAPVTQEQVDAAYAAIIASVQETIDEIYAKLEAGTSFDELVAEYGTDPGMEQEPYKSSGYEVHMDSILWDPAFVAGAFSVDEVGAVAQPVVGTYGVHIIEYTRDVPAGPVELTDELRSALADEVLADKESELFNQALAAWKAEAEITYSEEAQAMIDLFGEEE